MKKDIKTIINSCANYNRIINFDYLESDTITRKLIKVYKEYIFNTDMNDEDNFKTLEQFDYVLGKYLDDYEFRKELKKEIVRVKVVKSSLNIIKSIVVSINKIFDNYVESSTRVIKISRWI